MEHNLSEGSIIKTIFKTAVPTVIAFSLQSAFNIVDAIFVGMISAKALAAVSISFPIIFLIISLGTGLGIGSTAVVAQYIGAKKPREADNAAEHSLVAAITTGVLLMIVGFIITPTLFDWMSAQGELKELALSYINILLIFSPLMLVLMVGNSILHGIGDMKTPMIVMGASAILNIILDPIFIFTLGLGVEGAAYATVLSRTIGFIYLMTYLLRGKSSLSFDFRNFHFQPNYIKKIYSIGIPSSVSNIIMSIGMFIFTVIVGAFGENALAAFGIGFRLDSLALLPSMGVSVAVISIVGQSLGAGKPKRAVSAAITGGLLASVFMTFLGVVFYVFAPQIIGIFNSEPEVLEYGISFLRIIPFTYLIVGVAMSISGAFLGAGKANYALLTTFLRVLIFSVPAAYMISRIYGVEGIWIGIVIGTYLGAISSLILFKYTNWNKISIQTNPV